MNEVIDRKNENGTNVIIVDGAGCWMESRAADQLKKTAELPGCTLAIGLPDLHPGKTPVGAVIETEGIIYPHLIGNDIGCGMTIFRTGIAKRQFRAEKWAKKLTAFRLDEAGGIDGFGTLGGGNHFAEFQVIDRVETRTENETEKSGMPDKNTGKADWNAGIAGKDNGIAGAGPNAEAAGAGPDADVAGAGQELGNAARKDAAFAGAGQDEVLLLIHSGSRSLGQRICSEFASPKGLAEGTAEFRDYMEAHDWAVQFAAESRQAVAKNLLDALGFQNDPIPLLDCCHNLIEQIEGRYLHRKGAVRVQPKRERMGAVRVQPKRERMETVRVQPRSGRTEAGLYEDREAGFIPEDRVGIEGRSDNEGRADIEDKAGIGSREDLGKNAGVESDAGYEDGTGFESGAGFEWVIIPGSRGDFTYVAEPTERSEETLWTLAHGAGRKYQRSECRARIREKHRAEELKRTKLKSIVVCSNKQQLYEEAPEAYKNIEAVIRCMKERGLLEVRAVLRPLLTYKG